MKLHRFWFVVLICVFAGALATRSLAQQGGNAVPGRYIVQLKNGAAPERVIKTHGVVPDFVYDSVVNGFAGPISPGQLKTLKADSDVVSVVPDRVMTAIGGAPNVTTAVNASGKATAKPTPVPGQPQVTPAGVGRIRAAGAWTGAGVGVAVVDTGLDFNHQDLPINKMYYYTAYKPSAQDGNGHGTHVGGIIAAINNTIDVVGVAPGAKLYAVRVLNSQGSGTDSTILAGLNWVNSNAAKVNPPIRVVNMSLGRAGSRTDNPTMEQAIRNLYNKGIVVVVAAGNDSSLEVTQQVPACYPEVLAVASTTAKDGLSSYPGYAGIPADTASYFTTDGAFDATAQTGVTISAPGEDQENVDVLGYITSVGILSTKLGGGTTRMSGTSMAAPHVTGVVARLFDSNAHLVDGFTGASLVEDVRGLIREHADKIGSAPIASPTSGYSPDNEYEGIVIAPDNWVIPTVQ